MSSAHPPLEVRRDIDAAFVGRKSVEEVYAALEQHANQTWARGVLDLIRKYASLGRKGGPRGGGRWNLSVTEGGGES